MEQRTNAGFVIYKAVRIEDEEIVMGVNCVGTYVTWRCEPELNHYFWGHYFENNESAKIDFYERVIMLAETYLEIARNSKKEYTK